MTKLPIPPDVRQRLEADPSLLGENLPPPASTPREPLRTDHADLEFPELPGDESVSLAAARRMVYEQRDEGLKCPCCDQNVKVYRITITAGMAQGLITHYRLNDMGFAHINATRAANGATDNRQESKLAYWGLFEEEVTVKREDGGRRGFWRVTPHGVLFLRGELTVPKWLRTYNNEVIEIVQPERVSIHDALGHRFDLREIMSTGQDEVVT